MPIRAALAIVVVHALVAPALAQDDDTPDEIRPKSWLVIEPTNNRGRRPLRPDAVFRAHLLDPDSPPPVAGGKLTGENGEERAWQSVEMDDDDTVWLREGKDWKWLGYAHTTVEVPDDRIMLAELQGAATVFVNGEGFVGDVYRYGFDGVPVALKKGANHLYVRGIRGGFSFALTPVATGPQVVGWDFTAVDLVEGQRGVFDASVLVLNAQLSALSSGHLQASSAGDGFERAAWVHPDAVGPLCVAKLRLPINASSRELRAGNVALEARLGVPGGRSVQMGRSRRGFVPYSEAAVQLKVRPPEKSRLVTYRSRIDGTVQHYAVLEPKGETDRPMGLVMSVHGAGVNCRNQAGSYQPKPDFWIVAPTNRRPFGFDWQDWGRTDAYEVLDDALDRSGVERSRVYLTGHSMGGHGTWHLGANDPDGFAALAPSAGWISFDTYGRGRPEGSLRKLWHRADGPSSTLDLLDNLAQQPVFILHGTADDNVPPEQAEAMERALRAAGAFPKTHYQKDAGHWWNLKENPGAECLDWPGFFEMFREHRIAEHPGAVEFTSMAPAVDADHHWVHVHQPLEYGRKLNVRASVDVERETLEVHTSNVWAFRVDVPPWAEVNSYIVDGVTFDAALAPGGAWFVRDHTGWNLRRVGPGAGEKGPDRSGPFKRVFDNRFVLVYGTEGDEREDAALLARARYDSEQWWYRGNGNAPVVSDTAFVDGVNSRFGGRNVILYGNADTNAAWDSVFAEDCPVRAERGSVRIGPETFEGDALTALFLQPRKGDERALAGAFADSGVRGTRLGYGLSTFTSGAGFPDYLVFGAGVLTEGDGGVLAAGWFDRKWRYDRGYLAPR